MALIKLLFLFFAAICGCSYATLHGASLERRLQEGLNKSVESAGIPGAVLGVRLQDGRTYYLASGYSQITEQWNIPRSEAGADGLSPASSWPYMAYGTGINGMPVEPFMKFRAGSLTKTFLAVTVMQMVGEGKPTLDDTVGDLLGPVIQNSDRITVRHLLRHRSGIPNYTDHPDFFSDLLGEPLKRWNPEDLLKYSSTMEFEPVGRSYRYSNANYLLLGMIVEKVAGRPYSEEIYGRVIKKLGLDHTEFPDDVKISGRFSHGYRHDFKPYGRWKDYTSAVHPSWLGAAGCMVSNAPDLLTFIDALLSGRILDQSLLKEMTAFKPTGESGCETGLGLDRRFGAIGMTGDYVFGFESLMYRYRGVDYVVLTNGLSTRLGVLSGAEFIFKNASKVITGEPFPDKHD